MQSAPEQQHQAALVGRDPEQVRLAALLSRTRNGKGGSIAVLGEPGMGKSALLAAATTGTSLRVIRLDGYESESDMAFAAVQRLATTLRRECGMLPEQQRRALLVASGEADGPPPDRYLVGLGVLGLLAAASDGQGIVCTIDDAHLVDPESLDALAFVARRIAVERVAVVFAGRDEAGLAEHLGGVSQLVLTGLDTDAAVHLLNRAVTEPLPPSVALAIAQATGGNPLALIDLAGESLVHELPDLGMAGDPVPVGRHLEAHYVRRVRQADQPVQTWVLLAAADSTGNIDLLTAAGAELDLTLDDADRAEIAGLVQLSPTVRFRHPLVRSAVYNAASGVERRRVHRALALAADRADLTEAEAWHAARAVVGTDEEVAARLALTAELAARRGGLVSCARLLARAAELSPPGETRAVRQVGAAEAALAVGAAHLSQRLVEDLDEASAGAVTRGRALLIRSSLTLLRAERDGVMSGAADHLRAADLFHGFDDVREQDALLRAFDRCSSADRLMTGVTQAELGRRMLGGADLDGRWSVVLRGLAALILEPYDTAHPKVRAAFDAVLALPDDEIMYFGSVIGGLGAYLWDDQARAAGLDRAARAARDRGALLVLDTLLWIMALCEVYGGSLHRAGRCVETHREVRVAMGYDDANVPNVAVMAWSGEPRELVAAVADGAGALGFGGVQFSGIEGLVARDLADRRYQDAYQRHKPLVEEPFLQVTPIWYADFVESAVRSGHPDVARRVAQDLASRAAVNSMPWCQGAAERALALVSPDDEAEAHYLASVAALHKTLAETELGRSYLLYGEWLRRVRRRREAAEQLRLALRHLRHSGAEIFVPRVLAELEVLGARTDDVVNAETAPPLELTTQEHTIARLAASGRTNAEIAANLFISPNTVDYHLRKVFQKLGISSRRQLTDRLNA
ncbi:LuxR C-terminal-related transcriptional regulator [Nocardioides sp. NBC_00850]|uniref:LuxR C-terminal-related transcriptional regulator n=1 Tax=Nocardioides sp. NBC_00850 TaxID=2976001 RepID=UPI00386B45D6|nr:LuxR C-terminal-related transcriptional regulator [Nocardioides sp. NBC_00850]